MNTLGKYIGAAQNYISGDGSVERLRKFYEKNPELSEKLWKETFDDVEVGNFSQKALFTELLEKEGLYVYDEKIDPRDRNREKEVKFCLRVFRKSFSNDSYVAVLKICGLTYPTLYF